MKMGLASIIGIGASLYGASKSSSAAKSAASTQAESADKAIDFQREALETARGDLAPYREAGAEQLPGLTGLITDPNQQRDFIQNNPFFKTLADDAQSRLFSNAAARGKVGSGGTAKALQNSLMLLGNDLVGQNINRRMNLTTLGQNAAAMTGTNTLQGANTISDLMTQQGNVRAAGTVGSANAWNSGINTAISTGANLYSLLK